MLRIEDLFRCVEVEKVVEFVLIEHSYVGMVITGPAGRLPATRLDVLFLDALANGQVAADIVLCGAHYSRLADDMLPFIPDYDFGLTDAGDVVWVQRRITRQTVRTVTEPLHLRSDMARIRRTFVK